MISVSANGTCPNEWRYTVSTILDEFLGIPWIESENSSEGQYTILEFSGKKLKIAEVFFHMPVETWLKSESLPDEIIEYKIPYWLVDNFEYPEILMLFGCKSLPLVHQEDSHQITIEGDLLGSSFLLLSRYEEIVSADRDTYGRFPFLASLADRFGFASRVLVNEYTELLFSTMIRLWPELEGQRRKRVFAPKISHDIDHLFFSRNNGWKASMRRAAKSVLLDRDFRCAGSWLASRRSNGRGDPFFNLGFLMKESEKRGISSAFYFMAGHTAGLTDGDYEIDEPLVIDIIREIGERGHEIGLHPSFETFKNAQQLKTEFDSLRKVAERAGINQCHWGGRQHYLRWEPSVTPQNWESAGLDYDGTLGFAERPGFRCGTCYEFQLYDLKTRKCLNLRERPLSVMDVSVIDSRYLGLGTGNKALNAIVKVKNTCRRFKGDFNMLWHNTRLVGAGERRLYEAVLDA
jgi:hypothetical protein